MATLISNIANIVCPNTRKETINIFLSTILFPISVNNKCPETIFATSRILKVHGRIKFLVNSISTINLINIFGVLLGTRWANILFE